ncbi:component of oligomeric golgi complex 6 [Pochonia chlamydosporia 170]|uniref:Conserved oligomeric Golgi complex subunit 6 n=1 Tax=Pochonia chlamydosporia 170 TaxID=1380566 RepID=A0A179FM53_METCM|nr:component of oligomeric golgi complex 6 [Pochonia chlamydosporia 170]OAQ66652.1 component of oligomeric golgi complex 6 [Pochonia chlamydosporia 170]
MSEELGRGTNMLIPSTKSSNSLTTKVTAVLSTSFADAEFREALSLLDEKEFANDARNRRQIRIDFHKNVMDCNGVIVDSFGQVAEVNIIPASPILDRSSLTTIQQLHRVRLILGKLNAEYQDMKTQIALAKSGTSTTLSETSSLLETRAQVLVKQDVLSAFKEHFLMTEVEIVALTSTAEPVDDRFFDALSKAKKINKDCEILLGLEGQTFGLDLMEQTSTNLNFGFQKLYKWLQREFKTLNLENPQMNTSIRRALRVLAERPSLFQNCLDFFAEARERLLSEAFHIALTGTNSSGVDDASIKPIDLTAHDILRYVGDMLAWVHSATVGELEALEVLFIAEGEELAKGLRQGRDTEVWRLVADDEDDDREFNALGALNNLVDRDMAGVGRLVRQRVEQVIRTTEDIIPAYKLATLLSFYGITFERLLGPASKLADCVHGLENESLRQFRSLLKDNIALIQSDADKIPTDLAPPPFFHDALDQLAAIMLTFDSSLSSSAIPESEFEGVLTDALEPFMIACDNMAKSMPPLRASIFIVNFKSAASKRLAKFEFTKRRAEELRLDIAKESAKLVQHQYEFFRLRSGLNSLFSSECDAYSKSIPALNATVLAKASQQLDEFLPSALLDAIDRVKNLEDAMIARQITEEAAEMFCKDFEEFEKKLESMGPSTGASDDASVRLLFPRTSTEIRVLLS